MYIYTHLFIYIISDIVSLYLYLILSHSKSTLKISQAPTFGKSVLTSAKMCMLVTTRREREREG